MMGFRGIISVALVLAGTAFAGCARPPNLTISDGMTLTPKLTALDERYDPQQQMLWGPVSEAGYHTRLVAGSPAHPVRESLQYAAALLAIGDGARVKRAVAIVNRVVSLQDADPTSRTFGVWPWYLEEPLEQMAPPDWNWADFCGAQIGSILIQHPDRLAEPVRESMRGALANAAWSIFRRNMGPGYTNIAIMGAGVTAAAGEVLDEPRLLEYGRRRLQRCVEHARWHGGFNEYNSPTYTMVALTECDRILNVVRDPATREAATTLRRLAWQTIAESFHPGTGQWAGPHSRAYSDRVVRRFTRLVTEQTGVPVEPHPTAADTPGGTDEGVDYSPCPEELKARFAALPRDPVQIRRRYIRGATDEQSTWGTTWLSADACLGTVNYENLWVQRRPVIAYWRTASDPAVVLRLRFLRDGKDFPSAAVRTAQSGAKALSVVTLLTDRGDYHDHLDRPKDGVFHAADFRVRYELEGRDVDLVPVQDRVFDLVAGERRGRIQIGPGKFDGKDIRIAVGRDDGRAWVDAIFYEGPPERFDFARLAETWLAASLHLQTAPHDPPAQLHVSTPRPRWIEASWEDLQVHTPNRPHPYHGEE